MGEREAVPKMLETLANGNSKKDGVIDKFAEAVVNKKGECVGETESEVNIENKTKIKSRDMDVDKEVRKSKKGDEKVEDENNVNEEVNEGGIQKFPEVETMETMREGMGEDLKVTMEVTTAEVGNKEKELDIKAVDRAQSATAEGKVKENEIEGEAEDIIENTIAEIEEKAREIVQVKEDKTESAVAEAHGTEKKMEEVTKGNTESLTAEVEKEEQELEKDTVERTEDDVEEAENKDKEGEKMDECTYGKTENASADAGEENTTEEMEIGLEEKTENAFEEAEEEKESEGKAQEEVDKAKEKEANSEEAIKEKAARKRPRTKSGVGNSITTKDPENKAEGLPKNKKTIESKSPVDKVKEEPTTPAVARIERPIRERKSVERFVAIIEQDSFKEFQVGKGRGTALKDIPNVAYKLSRRKIDETLKLLHTILFGRRAKAAEIKNNILKFSGFVWRDNEEKHMVKVKEKLDKCIKEKLQEFCDVFNIHISKANSTKEEIIVTLVEFLVEPHAITSELHTEKEQSIKRKKRKRVSKSGSGTRSSTPSKGSSKSRKITEGDSTKIEGPKDMLSKSESGEEKKKAHEQGIANSIGQRSDDEMSEEAEAGESESDGKEKSKKETISEKANPAPKRTRAKSPPSRSGKNKDTYAKKSSGQKKDELVSKSPSRPEKNKVTSAKKSSGKTKDESFIKLPTGKKTDSKESTGKKILKVKDKLKDQKSEPTDAELISAISEILKEVDFNTATFMDILKQLSEQFKTDLVWRKQAIKLMLQKELTKLAEAEEDEG